MVVGKNLRKIRNREGLSILQLSKKCGVTTRTISEIERGLRDGRPDTVRVLAEALGVPESVLWSPDPEINDAIMREYLKEHLSIKAYKVGEETHIALRLDNEPFSKWVL